MKLMDKYILRAYLLPLVYLILAFSMIYVLYDLFDHLSNFVEADTPGKTIAYYYLCLLAPTAQNLVPASLLLAALYALWRFTRHNELTAMRASGVSLYRIMAPLLVVALVFSIAVAIISEVAAPQAFWWARSFAKSNFLDIPGREIHTDRTCYSGTANRLWRIGTMRLGNPSSLKGVKITEESPGTRMPKKEIFADKAKWLDGQWWFFDVKIQEYNDEGYPLGPEEPQHVPNSELGMEMPLLTETPSDIVNEIKDWEFLSAADMFQYLRAHMDLSMATTAEKKTDLHRRLAMPWACFIVTLFGIPTGARSGRQSALAGIFLAVGLLFAFYGVSQLGIYLGKTRIIWPWLGAWFSNIVFFLAGIWMVGRMK
jgi:lipopolysaccharide export system permease protein